jgi:HEAT repeat protein
MSTLSTLLLAGLALTASQDAASEPSEDAGRDAVVAVVSAAVDADWDAGVFAARLDEARDGGLQALFEILVVEGVPGAWTEDGSGIALDEHRLGVVSDCLLSASGSALRALLVRVAQEEPRLRFREVGVEILGEMGLTRDIRLLVLLAAPLDESTEVLPRSLRKAFEHALEEILERSEGGLLVVREVFDETHVGLRSAIVDAVESLRSEFGLETLADLLGRTKGLDAHVLTAISRVATHVTHPVDESVHAAVRERLDDADAAVMHTAIRACGRLEDYESLPKLLELLASDDEGTRSTAHRGLQDLTGLRFRLDERLWRSWYERETRWWQELQPDLARDVRRGSEGAATKAVMAFAGRHLWRHRLAEVLQDALLRRETTVVVHACRALEELGSARAVPGLLEALEHREAGVRFAAWEALESITGKSLPQDPAIWRASLAQGT